MFPINSDTKTGFFTALIDLLTKTELISQICQGHKQTFFAIYIYRDFTKKIKLYHKITIL